MSVTPQNSLRKRSEAAKNARSRHLADVAACHMNPAFSAEETSVIGMPPSVPTIAAVVVTKAADGTTHVGSRSKRHAAQHLGKSRCFQCDEAPAGRRLGREFVGYHNELIGIGALITTAAHRE